MVCSSKSECFLARSRRAWEQSKGSLLWQIFLQWKLLRLIGYRAEAHPSPPGDGVLQRICLRLGLRLVQPDPQGRAAIEEPAAGRLFAAKQAQVCFYSLADSAAKP